MPSVFDLTRPPPTTQDIENWRRIAERGSGDARLAAVVGIAAAGGSLLHGVLGSGGFVSIMAAGASLLFAALSILTRASFRKEGQDLKFFNLDPEQILVIFALTQDTRQYAAALLEQGRTVTLAELNLLQVYGRELGRFLQNLPPQLKEPMARHIGFHLFLEPAAA